MKSVLESFCRVFQFKISLGKTPKKLTEEDFINLGNACEGYTGSDITVFLKEAMMMPIRRCQTATKFRKFPDGFFESTYPSEPMGIDMNLFYVESSKLRALYILIDDINQALAIIKPSVCLADLDC